MRIGELIDGLRIVDCGIFEDCGLVIDPPRTDGRVSGSAQSVYDRHSYDLDKREDAQYMRDTSSVGMRSLRRRAEAEKQLESLVDAGELARRHLSEDAADAALVDRAEMINEGAGCLREAARPR